MLSLKYLGEDNKLSYEEVQIEFGSKYKDSPVVIIDSGLGGLKFASQLHKLKPSENIVFFADTEFLPLGNKDPRIVTRRTVKAISKLKKLKPKAVILACNTIDALAGDKLVTQLSGIELYRIVEPTAIAAIKASKNKQVGLIATTNVIQSQKYMYSMLGYAPDTHLIGLECYNLAEVIEKNGDIKATVKTEIEPLHEFNIDTLILGCTHYSAAMPIFKKEFQNVTVVDSTAVLLETFIKDFERKKLFNVANKGQVFIISTLVDENFENNVNKNFDDEELVLLEDKI